jgi:hypothetical protein
MPINNLESVAYSMYRNSDVEEAGLAGLAHESEHLRARF